MGERKKEERKRKEKNGMENESSDPYNKHRNLKEI